MADSRSDSRWRHWGLAIFIVALVVRVAHVVELRGAPFFSLKLGDSWFFDAWAHELAAGDWLGQEVFWYAPLYPYFLGAVYRVLGDDPLLVRLLQAVVGSVSCVLLAGAGRRFLSPPAGVVAGFFLAVYAPAIFYDGLLHKPVLAVLFLCLLLYVLGELVRRPLPRPAWLAAGAAAGALVLTRENGLVFVAAVVIWCLLPVRDGSRRRLALSAGLLLIGALLVLLPVAARNWWVGGEFHLTAANLGDNLYKGNNPRADGTYMPLRPGRGTPRFERQDATELAELALGRELTPAEVSRFWTGRVVDYVRSQPLDWLRLMGRKAFLLTNALEWSDSEDLYTHTAWSTTLRLAGHVAHLGVLVPLAVLGLWITWERRERLWLLYLMMGCYALSVVAFYVFGRYRYPLVPLLVLFAAAGTIEARRYLREASRAKIAAAVAATLVAAIVCNWPLYSVDVVRSGTEDSIGSERKLQGRLDDAIAHYRRAIELNPSNARARFNLAVSVEARGEIDAALRAYRDTLRVDPSYANAHVNLGVALARRGELAEAERHLRRALRIEPDHAAALGNLSLLLEKRGDTAAAIDAAQRAARRTRYRDPWALERLESAYLSAGDVGRAAEAARAALQLVESEGDSRRADALRRRLERYTSAP